MTRRHPGQGRYHLLAACGIALAMTSVPLMAHLRYNGTPSAPRGWYWYTPQTGQAPLTRGQHVLLTPPPEVYIRLQYAPTVTPTGHPWLKTVTGLAGDTVCWTTDALTINGAWAAGLELLSEYPLLQRAGCQTLADDEVVLLNPHRRSFDSRYVGPLARATIQGTMTALVTWEGR